MMKLGAGIGEMHSQQRGIVFWIQKGNKRASQNKEMLLLQDGRAQSTQLIYSEVLLLHYLILQLAINCNKTID